MADLSNRHRLGSGNYIILACYFYVLHEISEGLRHVSGIYVAWDDDEHLFNL